MVSAKKDKVIIVGGGLAGSLAACYLGEAGYQVEVYEARDDMRAGGLAGGRSINLALSHRGIEGLKRIGLADAVLRDAVLMRGRMMHAVDGSLSYQAYGKDDSYFINSVSRGQLNVTLLEAADRYDNVTLHFNAKCTDVDLDATAVSLVNTETGDTRVASADYILSCDGAFSAVRGAMQKRSGFDYSQSYLKHGYKELTIPAGEGGAFAMEKHALHIWPRHSFMMIALPNADGSYTCTLFWPFAGPNGFEAIKTEDDLRGMFRREFPDAMPLMPELTKDYFENPVGSMVTVRCGPWHWGDRVLLLGDAAHAIVPFYGQGINAGFEDVLVMRECMDELGEDWSRVFPAVFERRKREVDTLADMALANFVEMRDHTSSRWFLWKKRLEKMLSKLLPGAYLPLYTMATFTRIPYTRAIRRARRQDRIVVGAALAILLVMVGAIWSLIS